MSDKQYSVGCPVELPGNGKTIWVTIGRAFEAEDAKYAMKISLSALPVTAFRGEPVELFLFEIQDAVRPSQKSKRWEPKEPELDDEPPPPTDDDVAF